jgi:hypothetical protein
LNANVNKARFVLLQSSANLAYLMHVTQDLLPGIFTTTPPTCYHHKDGSTQFSKGSRFFTELLDLRKLWYVPNPVSTPRSKWIKVIPSDIIEFITPECLAHWIMCDGYWDNGAIILCTESFTLAEVQFLVDVLNTR